MSGDNLELVYNKLVEAGIQAVVALPDSHLSPLCKKIQAGNRIKYIQVAHESDCVGISTGLNMSGTKTLAVMENSGIRNACEIIARFHLSHRLFSCYLISHRGEFGERNWWGIAHHQTQQPLLEMLQFRWESLRSISELSLMLENSFRMLSSGQTSIALVAEASFLSELKK
ncbi:MAG: hypothetical protein IPP66_00045 [Anaerolineales bacterium]|nr:hypothetical protein [Anaerolineales bacterium]